MFNRVAKNYDLMNLIMTFGCVYFWRKAALLGVPKVKSALDLATGTGAFIPEIRKLTGKIVGVDFSSKMLEKARVAFPDLIFHEADALALPFQDKSFELVTVGFGVRNFEDLNKGLLEIKRVLNGTLVILESGPSDNFLGKLLSKIQGKVWVPIIARIFSPDPAAYNYLLDSTSSFLSGRELKELLINLGFREVELRTLAFGNINILRAIA